MEFEGIWLFIRLDSYFLIFLTGSKHIKKDILLKIKEQKLLSSCSPPDANIRIGKKMCLSLLYFIDYSVVRGTEVGKCIF